MGAKQLFYLSVVSTFALVTLASSDCKCVPSEDCWPLPSAWATLNDTVEGRLIRPVLPASVCYPRQSNYDANACAQVISNWSSSAFHATNPVSVDSPMDANNSCNPIYPNGTSITGDPYAGTNGCTRGYYPLYVVNATQTRHVQAAVNFAQKYNLRLNVKNTGHGRSATADSLSVWTHYMKELDFSPTFHAAGCNANIPTRQMAIIAGAGVQDDEVYVTAATHNAVVVGGTDSTVGLVGWLTGGGHGYLTGSYGMGADNLLQAVMVTPSGDIITANACQNSDIFWAIRGGGGGTFGVITQVAMQAYPMPTTTIWILSVSQVNGISAAKWWDLVAYINSEIPRLKDAGMQGYYTATGAPLSFSNVMFAYDKQNGTVEALVAPIIARLKAENGTATFSSNVAWSASWIDFYNTIKLTEPVGGGGGVSGSRLIPARALTDDIDFLARTLEKIGPKAANPSGPISNPILAGSVVANSHQHNNALNPAWRDAVIHLIVKESWSDGLSADQAQAAISDMTYGKGYALRQLAPDSGAYFNEANLLEPNWQWMLFGRHYSRLAAIKRKYDPRGLLWCFRCVGSEDWVQSEDGRLCRQAWA